MQQNTIYPRIHGTVLEEYSKESIHLISKEVSGKNAGNQKNVLDIFAHGPVYWTFFKDVNTNNVKNL